MHPDEQARLTKLAVTPNPVKVDNFVAPQPEFDLRAMPGGAGGAGGPVESLDSRRIRSLEHRISVLEQAIDDILRVISNIDLD